jgi:aldehyde:ferredoxin oxidoreductase
MQTILRINMANLKIKKEDLEKGYQQFGGRGFSSYVIKNEVPPTCHPLGRYNKLIIAPGLLGGSLAPNSGRLSFGAKSPLTGTIKESNAGGEAGRLLGTIGIKAIIIEDKPKKEGFYLLFIAKDKTEFVEASELRGLGNYDTVKTLKKRFGPKVAIISIGQAGEMKLGAASIGVTDIEGRPTRHAGRGGLGAVMGTKGLKAIVIDPKDIGVLNMLTKRPFLRQLKVLVLPY